MSGRVTKGLVFDEPLIFELKGSKDGQPCAKSDVPDSDLSIVDDVLRKKSLELPNLSEPEIVRHFTRLSILNYHKDLGLYPLGSCTMKHNPKIADRIVSEKGFSSIHPLQDDDETQGSMRLMFELENLLKEISGMKEISLWPAAGSHGELAGMLMIKSYHAELGNKRKYVLIPDSAHGTNPASAAVCGYDVKEIKSTNGILLPETVQEVMNEDVAAIMITNPNTLGIFEKHYKEICEIVHAKGGLVYCDGANLNALMGYVKPGEIGTDVLHFNLHKTFATPHGGGGPGAGPIGVSEKLIKYLPNPRIKKENDKLIWEYDDKNSIGMVKSFWGNFGVLVRAYVYIKALGADGLKEATENAVLAANYVKSKLKNYYDLPFDQPVLHECVFSDKIQNEFGVKTLDIAKKLMDYGIHPPTIYFPLIVHGAIMIEPTETESKEVLDDFCSAMIDISKISKENSEEIKSAPTMTPRQRLDEAKAAKDAKIKY